MGAGLSALPLFPQPPPPTLGAEGSAAHVSQVPHLGDLQDGMFLARSWLRPKGGEESYLGIEPVEGASGWPAREEPPFLTKLVPSTLLAPSCGCNMLYTWELTVVVSVGVCVWGWTAASRNLYYG